MGRPSALEQMIDFLLGSLAYWLLALAAVSTLWGRFRRRYRVGRADNSLLLGYYTDGVRLLSVAKGDLSNGAIYNVIATNSSSVMYMVQLPFHSTGRLVAIPTAAGVPQITPSGDKNVLVPVGLEGNFPQYFNLYASADQKSNVQYILDPKAMAFTIDFCATHSWEIIDDELIIVASPAANEVISLSDIEQFMAEIRPRIARDVKHVVNRNKLSYGSLKMMSVQCPICNADLVLGEHWLSCPNRHGMLVTGKVLRALSHGDIELPTSDTAHVAEQESAEPRKLRCPACSANMHAVDYLGRGIAIDSCSKCHFRWLDAGEAAELRS